MTLQDDLRNLRPSQQRHNPYFKFNLLRNPFPGYGDVPTDVCTDQESVKSAYYDRLRGFKEPNRRLRINGESGAGKTTVLRYFERLTDEARAASYIEKIIPLYVLASGEDYFSLHDQLIEKLLERTLADLISILRERPETQSEIVERIPLVGEVLTALQGAMQRTLVNAFTERKLDVFERWFRGQKIAVSDRRFLGGVTDIGSASLAVKYLQGYIAALGHLRICDGIVLLIDEFEQIFVSLSRTKQSRYAQDLRFLVDSLEGTAFIVFATVPEPQDLRLYPAVERRLGEAVALHPIDSLDLAVKFVADYMRAGRLAFEEAQAREGEVVGKIDHDSLTPLSREAIGSVFEGLQKRLQNQPILPGYFLPEIRQVMKGLVEAV